MSDYMEVGRGAIGSLREGTGDRSLEKTNEKLVPSPIDCH